MSDQRSQMLLVTLLTLWIELASSFRGPHHPRSDVSHHHYTPQKEIKLTQDKELLHDTTHLKEDMGGLADHLDLSKMTEQELEFHYFKLHDIDNNTKLDGLEILHAIQHTLHDHEKEENDEHVVDGKERTENDLLFIVDLIDRVLEEDDLDNDGYLGYIEYVLGRQRDQNERTKKLKITK